MRPSLFIRPKSRSSDQSGRSWSAAIAAISRSPTPNRGKQLERLAQRHVDRAEPAADRGGARSLEGDPVVADRVEGRLGDEVPVAVRRGGFAGVVLDELDRRLGGPQHPPSRVSHLRTDAVARYQDHRVDHSRPRLRSPGGSQQGRTCGGRTDPIPQEPGPAVRNGACSDRSPGGSHGLRTLDDPELLHHAQVVLHTPMLHDLAVGEPDDVDLVHLHRLTGGGDAQKSP